MLCILGPKGNITAVSKTPINIRRLLSLSFNEAELRYLRQQPGFSAAFDGAVTYTDVDNICLIAEDLLIQRAEANPDAAPLRPSSKQSPRDELPSAQ